MTNKKNFTRELGSTRCSIMDVKVFHMESFLNPENKITISETKAFRDYQKKLESLKEIGDYLTFPELVKMIRDVGIERDLSFGVHGDTEMGKFLFYGTPEYMAEEGVVFMANCLTYPQQLKTRDFHPDPPEDKEEDIYHYPRVALLLELLAGNANGSYNGRVRWVRFESWFPKDTYIPYKERVRFDGTWDQCVQHYIALAKRIKKAGKKILEENP